MGVRYLLATVVGYVAFLSLIRAWLSWQRRTMNLEVADPSGLADVFPDAGGDAGSPDPFSGSGGDFGGAGASGEWQGADLGSSAPVSSPSASADVSDAFSLDDAWPVVLAVAALCAGAVAVGFVIYTSPILFAEVLVDAVVLGAIYRRSTRHDTGDWIGGVLGRTWLPATALCLFMGLLGAALQALAPEEASFGGVVRSVVAPE